MIEIIHVSDLHFGKQGWTNRTEGLLKRIQREYPFDKNNNIHLLVTGDIIHNSKLPKPPWRGEYRRAWRSEYRLAMKALGAFSPRVHIVPGNHDYGFGGIHFSKKCADYFDDRFLPALRIRHRFQPKQLWVETLDDGKGSRIMLIHLNSCLMKPKLLNISKGEIEAKQLTSLHTILRSPQYAKIPKMVCLHHIPHRRAKGPGMSLIDHKPLMRLLANRVDALAFGHEGAMKAPGKKRTPAGPPDPRPMAIRSGGHHGIKYYLDANACVKEQSCYHVKVEGRDVTARLEKLAARGRA